MNGIVKFLEARIAEDETAAKAATPGPWSSMTEETGNGENIYYTVEHGTDQLCDMSLTSRQGRIDADHIARHDPSRVLAECAVKRAIIAKQEDALDTYAGARVMDHVLAALAAVYADHPDYRQEWARG